MRLGSKKGFGHILAQRAHQNARVECRQSAQVRNDSPGVSHDVDELNCIVSLRKRGVHGAEVSSVGEVNKDKDQLESASRNSGLQVL